MADNNSSDSQQSALTVDCNASLESLLAQHIFTAFMWSMAIDMRVRFDDDSSILSCKDYRVEDSDTLLSLRLESKTLAEMTEGIQGTGLCSLLEAYICIIPPLSSAKRLPVRAVVDFARQQRKGPELLGLWEKVVPVYIRLFREFKPLGERHPVFLHTTAIMIDALLSATKASKLRKQ